MKRFIFFALRFIKSPHLSIVLRIYIGLVFIYASLIKIHFPVTFAENIAAYQIIPYWMVNFMSIFLPWLELITGLSLIFGLRTKASALIIGGMLVVFIIALNLSIFRDLPISCGCFSIVESRIGWWEIFRDLFWLLCIVQIVYCDELLQLRLERVLSFKNLK